MGRKKGNSQLYEELKNKKETDLTPQERRQLEREKLATLSIGGKLGYLWTYYKIWLVVALVVIGAGKFFWDMYDNSKNNVLLAVSIGNAGLEDPDILGDNFKEYLENDNPRDLVNMATNLSFAFSSETMGSNPQVEYATRTALIATVAANELDVLIGPKGMYEEYQGQELFEDLTKLFTPEQCQEWTFTEDGCALVVENPEKITDYMTLVYSPVYITIPTSSEKKDMAVEYITYLMEP